MEDKVSLAVGYAKRGFKIVMLHGINEKGNCTCSKGANCKSSGKHPIYSDWAKKATTSEEKIREEFKKHPNANIGFATGGNYFVLDIDEGGYESLKEYGELKETLSVRTGSGGSHHYYLMPEGVTIPNKVGLLKGVDIRSDGGIVVAPYSIHKSGNCYEWINEIEMATPDKWLVDLILNKRTGLKEIPDVIEEGSRNAVMASMAGALRRKGLSFDGILAALLAENNKRCNPPLSDSEVETIAKSICRYTPEDPITGEEWEEFKSKGLLDTVLNLDDYSKVYEKEMLHKFSMVKANDPSTYALIKAKLKGKVNFRDLEKSIKHMKYSEVKTYNKRPLELKGLETKGYNIPFGWNVDFKDGIVKCEQSSEGNIKTVPVSFTPVVISRRFHNLDMGTEKVELSFYRDNNWRNVLAARSVIFNRNSILKLADSSFPVSSNNSSDLISYLSDFERENDKVIPLVKSVARLGWLKDNEFFPYSTKESLEFENDSKEASTIMSGLKTNGDYIRWLEVAKKARENAVARFVISASFASILLEPLHKRGFFIHLWHNSRSGKTATIKLAMSAFGNPHKLIGSFNSTLVGLERMAAALRNLPFAIDELQVLNTKKISTENIIYMLAQGQGRTRGSKEGGIQETLTWRNIILTTGEEAMIGDNTQDGANTRTFEIYAKPVEDISLASLMHEVSEEHYGFAGSEFVTKLCKDVCDKKDFLTALYEDFKARLKVKYQDCIHIDEVSIVCLGDYLSSIYVFGEDEVSAKENAIKTALAMIENNRQLMRNDNIERAWEVFCGWVIANNQRFQFDTPSPRYGRIDANENYLVIPTYAHKALEEAGFSPKKVFRGFAERGYIESQVDSEGIRRFQISRSIGGKSCRVYVVKVPIGDKKEELNRYEAYETDFLK
ncbi:DUF927 domain-containing protein [Caloramator proteoclasticus]|uniref:Primase C terminal 1 (PriCT-1) n=1 Tax=Caloramator proteoclasticus DSM 10124 TaxID=1121262 RepID=A0A1M4X8R2_9CLOT|nr:DUF927 domain-containing protein [Caloramator proteoclasticus]SHE89532.1 Primase C terminal 1 (PriCT-1) [Caloramator proteoclasticus DSM 10124]